MVRQVVEIIGESQSWHGMCKALGIVWLDFLKIGGIMLGTYITIGAFLFVVLLAYGLFQD